LKGLRSGSSYPDQSGSGTGEGTGSKPGFSDVPSDDLRKNFRGNLLTMRKLVVKKKAMNPMMI
nr:hypothetical protein [Tanacetum cinerariifolium]